MTTELSFLVSLLLDHKLPKLTQKAVKERISQVEMALRGMPTLYAPPVKEKTSSFKVTPVATTVTGNPILDGQPESMRRILEKNPDLAAKMAAASSGIATTAHDVDVEPSPAPQSPPIPANPIAISAALQKRQELINAALAGSDAPSNKGKSAPKSHA